MIGRFRIGPRLRAIVVKELWAILRDPRSRIILIAPPLVQLFLFGFASTMEVNNIRIGVLDLDGGQWSRAVIERLDASPNVREVLMVRSDAQLREAVAHQRVIAALRFGPHFSADVSAGRGATIGAVLDGRRSNAAQIVGGYVERITGEVAATAVVRRSGRAGMAGGTAVTHWFNPNLENLWFVMPSLIAIIAAVSAMGVVSQSVARERELGTHDQLMVSPLRTWEILVGKMVPPVLIGLANVSLFVVLVPTVFGVPLTGSLLIFYVAVMFYLVALTGMGMLISTLSSTQQQAFLGMFTVTVPLIILSGYASPIDNMPGWLQVIAWANPASWFLEISEGTFLKSLPLGEALANLWPIAAIAVLSMAVASALFRSRME